MRRQLRELGAAAVDGGDDALNVVARILGVHDATDDGHAVDAGAGEIFGVVCGHIANGDDWDTGGLDQGGVALKPQGRAAGVLCRGIAERTGTDVVDDVSVIVGGLDKLEGACGQADDGIGAEKFTGDARVQVVLADVDSGDAVGFKGEGDVDAVVDKHARIRVDLVHGGDHGQGEIVKVAGADGFAAHLDDSGAALGSRAGGLHNVVGRASAGDEVTAEVQITHVRHCREGLVVYGLSIHVHWEKGCPP